MDLADLRDVAIIVASAVLSVAAIILVVGSVVLFRRVSRVLEVQRRTLERVGNVIGYVEESLKSISIVAAIITGVKKAFESFSKTEEERRE